MPRILSPKLPPTQPSLHLCVLELLLPTSPVSKSPPTAGKGCWLCSRALRASLNLCLSVAFELRRAELRLACELWSRFLDEGARSSAGSWLALRLLPLSFGRPHLPSLSFEFARALHSLGRFVLVRAAMEVIDAERLRWFGLSLRLRHSGLPLQLWWRCCWLDAWLQLLEFWRGSGALTLRWWWGGSEQVVGFPWMFVVGLCLDGDID
jgi:hypothetical protein